MRAVKILVILSFLITPRAHGEIDISQVRSAREEVGPEVSKKLDAERAKLEALLEEVELAELEAQELSRQVAADRHTKRVTVAISGAVMAGTALTGYLTLKPLKGQTSYVGKFLYRMIMRTGAWVAGEKIEDGKTARPAEYLISLTPEQLLKLQNELTAMRVRLQMRLQSLGQRR